MLFHQTDVLTSMNVLKEVTIVIPMQLATIKEAHLIANVTLVSKAVGLFVKILTNAQKLTLLQQHPVLLPNHTFVITISIAKIQSEVITVRVIATEFEIMDNVMIRNGLFEFKTGHLGSSNPFERTNAAIKLTHVTVTLIASIDKDNMSKMLVSDQPSKAMKKTKRIVKIPMNVIAMKVMKVRDPYLSSFLILCPFNTLMLLEPGERRRKDVH